MRAIVYHDVGDIRLEEVADPTITDPTDAIVRVTTTAICGTDLHFVRGAVPGMKPGTVLGHEAVGVVEELGPQVRNLRVGDRVVVPSTVGCGWCSYCRAGYFAQCDHANPNGPLAGTCFFGGPETTGPVDGLQATYARIPFANVGPLRLPHDMADDDAILLSDILPTAWFGADLAGISDGDTVAVIGAGVVGQLAAASALEQGAGRVLVVDRHEDRLGWAVEQGAEPINFDREDPVETMRSLTGGIGVDRAIDCVGVDAERTTSGPAAAGAELAASFDREVDAATTPPEQGGWQPGDAPSQALRWAVEGLAKAGTLSIIGVYPPTLSSFPIGTAMQKNLTIRSGNCNHRRYLPRLIDLVASGTMSLAPNLSHQEPFDDAIAAYRAFDDRSHGWLKVALAPGEG